MVVDNIKTTMTTTTTTGIEEEDDLELNLSLRPRNSSFSSSSTNTHNNHHNPLTKRDAQAIRRHEAKLKRDFKRKAQEDFVQNPRKVNNVGFATVAPPWLGWNGGGFRGDYGNFFTVGKDCGSLSSGSSSGVSDNYQSISGPGANSSDAGSHSSHPHSQLPSPSVPSISSELPPWSSQLDLQYSSNPNHSKPQLCSSGSNKIERMSSSTQSSKSPEGAATPSNTNCQNNGASPSSDKDSNTTPQSITPKEGKRETRKPPRPVVKQQQQQQQQQQQKLLFSQMPCVSTTGNGPNGKTINGFLYKYNKAEVSIVCVCHGSLFSPAEFVKHAGGVDVEYPLKHIRVDPFGLS